MTMKWICLFLAVLVFACVGWARDFKHDLGVFQTAEIVMQDDDDISYLGLGLSYQMGINNYLALHSQSSVSFHHHNALLGILADVKAGWSLQTPGLMYYLGVGVYETSIFTEGKDAEQDFGVVIPFGVGWSWTRFALDIRMLNYHKSLASVGVKEYYSTGIGFTYRL